MGGGGGAAGLSQWEQLYTRSPNKLCEDLTPYLTYGRRALCHIWRDSFMLALKSHPNFFFVSRKFLHTFILWYLTFHHMYLFIPHCELKSSSDGLCMTNGKFWQRYALLRGATRILIRPSSTNSEWVWVRPPPLSPITAPCALFILLTSSEDPFNPVQLLPHMYWNCELISLLTNCQKNTKNRKHGSTNRKRSLEYIELYYSTESSRLFSNRNSVSPLHRVRRRCKVFSWADRSLPESFLQPSTSNTVSIYQRIILEV